MDYITTHKNRQIQMRQKIPHRSNSHLKASQNLNKQTKMKIDVASILSTEQVTKCGKTEKHNKLTPVNLQVF